MKKALSLILALVMCLSLCACGGSNEENNTSELNDAGTTLTILHNGLPTSHQDETEYTKK